MDDHYGLSGDIVLYTDNASKAVFHKRPIRTDTFFRDCLRYIKKKKNLENSLC